MYREDYVLAVRQGNQTLKEEAGKVLVPFGDTYELRLKNKRGRDAIAFIYIDGKSAVKGGLVVKAHSHIDLERFVEDNLNSGNRFRFVSINDRRINDKGEPENGTIEVKFHEVKETRQLTFPWPEVHHYHYDEYPWARPLWRRPWHRGDIVYCSSASGKGQALSSSASYSCGSVTPTGSASGPMNVLRSAQLGNAGEAGATIEGPRSDQSFQTVSMDYDKDKCVLISIQLAGYKKASGHFCPDCGFAAAYGKFCSHCGAKL